MIVQSDDVCQALLFGLKDWLNAGPTNWLRLYTNGIGLSPAKQDPGLYVQATYGGYAQLAVLGSWQDPFRESEGVWRLESGPHAFQLNAGDFAQDVRGWYLVRGDRVILAEEFPTPIPVAVGATGPTILVRVTQGSQSVVCPESGQ